MAQLASGARGVATFRLNPTTRPAQALSTVRKQLDSTNTRLAALEKEREVQMPEVE